MEKVIDSQNKIKILDIIFKNFFNDIEIEDYSFHFNNSVTIYPKKLIGVVNDENLGKCYIFLKNNNRKKIPKQDITSFIKRYCKNIFTDIFFMVNNK